MENIKKNTLCDDKVVNKRHLTSIEEMLGGKPLYIQTKNLLWI